MEDNKLEYLIVKIGLLKARAKAKEDAAVQVKLLFFLFFPALFFFLFPFFLHRFSPPSKRTALWHSQFNALTLF
jgi:hypothetical protein